MEAPEPLLDKQQIKLETIFRSLAVRHKRLRHFDEERRKEESGSAGVADQILERHPSRHLFDSSYTARCSAFDRLKKYAKVRMKKRLLNFKMT